MQTPEVDNWRQQRQRGGSLGAVMGVLAIPVLVAGACVALPYHIGAHWVRQHREHRFRMLMKSQRRLIGWHEFLRLMRELGGTCIEEKFSAKGPVRFWWTPEDVYAESPFEIIDWFTMRKGRRSTAFVGWCRERYTSADRGSALLVDTFAVPKREIYKLWSHCRSESKPARWVEVAPPEILPPGAAERSS
jgi:hypothetical protein